MSDDTDDVDPESLRPEGHYPRFRDNEWHYIPDELAQTISLGLGGNGEEGQDWVFTYTPEKRDPEDREKVLVRLTPRALHELYIEVKDLDVETRQMGHRAECDLCGELVDLDGRSRTPAARRVISGVGQSIQALRTGSVTTRDRVLWVRFVHYLAQRN